jgi:hypothetical protein
VDRPRDEILDWDDGVIRVAVHDGANSGVERVAGQQGELPFNEQCGSSLAECSGLSLKRDDWAHGAKLGAVHIRHKLTALREQPGP